jgi:hypothetical protein
MTPEENARQQIDLLLQQSGWIVQDRSLAAGPGVAIREAALRWCEWQRRKLHRKLQKHVQVSRVIKVKILQLIATEW